MVLGLGLLESWRVALIRPNVAWRRFAMLSLIPGIGAAALEALLRRAYHAFAKQHYDWDYHTELQPEWTGLAEKAGASQGRELTSRKICA
jgi:hypothetical protein